MTSTGVLLIVLIVALLALAGAAAGAWWAGQPRALARRLRHRLVVTLKDGTSFDGLLAEADARVWVLVQANAHGVGDRGEDVPVDGELIVLVADVQFAQKP